MTNDLIDVQCKQMMRLMLSLCIAIAAFLVFKDCDFNIICRES